MTWLPVLMVLILTAGFAKLSIAALNWTFAHRLSKRVLILGHTMNVVAIVAYPRLLCVSLGRPSLIALWQSPCLDVSTLGWLVVAIGCVGLILLIWSTVEHQLTIPPRCLLKNESKLLDLKFDGHRSAGTGRSSWQQTLVGRGPMRRVALLPRNEQFSIRISTKTFVLPNLPNVWDGISIVHLSDTHFRGAVTRAYFEAVCDEAMSLHPDIMAFTGDLLDDMNRLDWVSATLGKLTAPYGCYFVLGNHDWHLDPQAIRYELERQKWIDLAGRCVSLEMRAKSSPLILCGDETPWMGTHPDLSFAPADASRILLSHTPDNITWARQQRINLMLAGHTHGGQIRLPILGPLYSPSRFGCRYSAGEFWLEPTLLYVSRGISGREPIRYNCPPELTKLVLRTGSSP